MISAKVFVVSEWRSGSGFVITRAHKFQLNIEIITNTTTGGRCARARN